MGVAVAEEVAVKSEPYVWKSVIIKANGFIDGVVFSPTEKGLVYMHTDMGGAYRLDAAKGEWVCMTDWIQHDDWSLSQMGAETLAVDPTDAKRVYIGLGTYLGPSAIVRSVDQGKTWERTNVTFGMNGNGDGRNAGERMNVDPNLPSRLIYGTRDKGLFVSSDYGATWEKDGAFGVTGDSVGPGKQIGISWTLFDGVSGKAGAATPVSYAGVCTLKADKIFRTVDGGKTWRPMPGQPGGGLMPVRAALTADGKTMYLTYATGEHPGPYGVTGGTVYRVDGPASAVPLWTEIVPKGVSKAGGGGWSGVTLDRQHVGTVYISTIDHYGDGGDDIFRSRDRGMTWERLWINKHRDDSSAPYAKDSGIHWTGDVQVDPNDANVAFFTTGYGLYRTGNLMAAEPDWVFYNEGFEQSAALELVSPSGGSANLLSAIGDRDGYRHENLDESPKFGLFGQKSEFGQAENLAMGTNPSIDVAANKPDAVVRVGGAAQYSDDGGITWKLFTPGEKKPERGSPQGGHIAISVDGMQVVWSPDRGTVVYAKREGDGWSKWVKAAGLVAGGERRGPAVVADRTTVGVFYAKVGETLSCSEDGGATWQVRAEKIPAGAGWMRSVPGHSGHLWLVAGNDKAGSLYRSTDGGRTWGPVDGGVLKVVKQVGVGAAAPGKEYPAVFVGGTVGEKRGFFRSDDEGATWVQINDTEHHYGNVTVINGDSRVWGRLYVGTNGRGILYADKVK